MQPVGLAGLVNLRATSAGSGGIARRSPSAKPVPLQSLRIIGTSRTAGNNLSNSQSFSKVCQRVQRHHQQIYHQFVGAGAIDRSHYNSFNLACEKSSTKCPASFILAPDQMAIVSK